MSVFKLHVRLTVLLALALTLAGCATLQPDAGLSGVQREADARLIAGEQQSLPKQGQNVAEAVAELLTKQPLSADNAVRLALLNNPELRVYLSDLGIADAERVQAGRLSNPGFSYSRSEQGSEIEIERRFVFSIFDLLTMPARMEIAEDEMEVVRLRTSRRVMSLALEARMDWVDAVAAEESLRYWRQVNEAAKASAELAKRMSATGNWGVREQAREQAFYADSSARLALAQQKSIETRERLIRQLGLWGAQTAFTLPERLPDLPAQVRTQSDVEQQALRERLDVQQARQQAVVLSKTLDLSAATRFGNVLDVAAHNTNYNEGVPVKRGYEIEIVLPIFDLGEARMARHEAVYMQAVESLRGTAILARSEAREAYLRYRTAFDLARHYRHEIVPLRQRIAEENVLRYNGMLIGVFELLADARVQIQAVIGAIEAQRNFWQAEADLRMALSVGSPQSSSMMMTTPAAAEATAGGH